MNNSRLKLVACVSLFASAFAQAGSPSHFLATPVGVSVKQGVDANGSCVQHVMKGAEYGSCIIATQQLNAKKGGDTTPYDLGLFFDAWYTMDALAHPDDVPTLDTVKQASAAAKPEAVRFFKLYRAIQKKVSVTDDELIVLYELNQPELLKARIAAAARETGA